MDKEIQRIIRDEELYMSIQQLSDKKKDILERLIAVLKN